MADDKYSVLMSVYKNEKPAYLRESIDSMLAQTRRPDDFVIVCDGPLTADLEKELENYQKKYTDLIQLIRLKENMGLGLALREGLKHCKYDLVARMDADDISLKNRIKEQVVYLEKHPEIDMCGTNAWNMKENGKIVGFYKFPINDTAIKYSACIFNPFFHVLDSFLPLLRSP